MGLPRVPDGSDDEPLPEVDRFAVHEVPVSLPAGTEKTLTPLVVEAPYGYRAELRDRKGQLVAAAAPGGSSQNKLGVALLTEAGGAGPVLEGLPGVVGASLAVTVVSRGRDFPDQVVQLQGLAAVVIDDFDTASLSGDQLRALQGFVGLGGSLVVGGGSRWRRTVAPLPAELQVLVPSGTASVSLGPLADIGGSSTSAVAMVATGELRGRPLLQGGDGVPLVVGGFYGAGRIIQLAYDPLAEPIASDSLLSGLAWQQGLARAVAGWGSATVVNRGSGRMLASEEQLWFLALDRPGWPGWPGWGLALLVGYALSLGVGVHLLCRFSRRAGLVWVTVALAAAGVAAVAVVTDGARPAVVDKTVAVHRVSPDGTAVTNTYHGLVSLRAGPLSAPTAGGVAGSTVFVEPQRVRQPTALGDTLSAPQQSRGAGGGVVVNRGEPRIRLGPVKPWELRNAQVLSAASRGGVEAHLRVVGAGRPPQAGLRLVGRVTNHGSSPLRELRAQLPEGVQGRVAGEIAPGATIDIDAPLLPVGISADGSVPKARPEEFVLFAAASRAFSRPGQVALVGLGSEPGGPPGGPLEVVVQVMALEGAETLAAVTGSAELVAELGTAFAVYDLSVLPGSGPLAFSYYTQGAPLSPEVFDWTSGAWRALPPPTLPGRAVDTPLRDQEVNEGLVRVRIRESPLKTFIELKRQRDVGG